MTRIYPSSCWRLLTRCVLLCLVTAALGLAPAAVAQGQPAPSDQTAAPAPDDPPTAAGQDATLAPVSLSPDTASNAAGAPSRFEPAFLVSIFKPIAFFLLLLGWGYAVSFLDKDAAYYHVKRHLWGAAHIGAGIVGFGLLLLIPIFWIGLPIAILILGGDMIGYALARNKEVPEGEKWTFDPNSVKRRVEQRQVQKAIRRATLILKDASGKTMLVPGPEDPARAAYEQVDALLEFAIPRSADRIDMAIDAEKSRFSVRIDGVRYPQDAPPPAQGLAVADYLKAIAGMDIEDRRKRQTGKCFAELEAYGEHKLAMTTMGSTRGLTLSLDIDPTDEFKLNLNRLGLLDKQRERLTDLLEDKGGVVLIAGSSRSGVTSLMLSLLAKHDAYTSSVISFEDAVEFEIEGVSHNVYDKSKAKPAIDDEFASLLRTDPDAVMLSGLVDQSMTEMVAKSAEDVRFYVPMPATDALSALSLWVRAVGQKRLAAESLRGVIGCRLLRRLCTTCRAPYTPDPSALKRLGLNAQDGTTLYRASGKVLVKEQEQVCPACHGMAYRGRIGAYEIIPIDASAQSYIASGEGDHLKAHLRKQGLLYLREAALQHVLSGVTDIKEVQRVLEDAS